MKSRSDQGEATMDAAKFEYKLDELITEAFDAGMAWSDIIAGIEAKLREVEKEADD
jgi:hypothetical protein